MKTTEEKAREIAKLMEDGKGKDVTLLDISGLNSWTDYFVIVTVNSSAHWQGLYKQVKEYIKANDLEIHLTNKKTINKLYHIINQNGIVFFYYIRANAL